MTSLHEVDAGELELSDLDLSACLFTGIRHPEGLRLSGCALAVASRSPWPRLRWWPLRRVPNHG